jgi:redox-sensitive bicupin YhaK (pirin superfamily)
MTARSVAGTLDAVRTVEGAGFVVNRPFPRPGIEVIDPFLLLDEMGPAELGPGEAQGAPDHPHRGFETVTYMLDGALEHEDSVGNKGYIGPGDIQWMTAGAGVVHSEMPAATIREHGGRMHGLQLWVNLPRELKMTPPQYRDILAADVPVVDEDGAVVRVIAGDVNGVRGPVEPTHPVSYVHVTLQPGSSLDLPVAPDHNAMLYVLSGEARLPDEAGPHQLVVFERDGDHLHVEAAPGDDPLDAIVLTGRPLNEPVARYGPFVMNTRSELLEAVEDYQAGRLGQITRT